MSGDPAITLVFALFACVVIIGAIRVVRKVFRPSDQTKPVNYDFTVGELNELVRAGKLSPDEFEKAKAAVLKRAAIVPPPAAPKGARGFDVLQRPDDEDDESSREAR